MGARRVRIYNTPHEVDEIRKISQVKFEDPKSSTNVILISTLAFGIANLVIFLWLLYFDAQSPSMTLSDAKALSSTTLCPGDMFTYSFAIDTTRTTQVEVNIYIKSDFLNRRSAVADQIIYQLEGNSRLNVILQWMVPPFWGNPENPSPEKWSPGPYHLEIIGQVSGNRPGADPLFVPFSISRNCIEVQQRYLPQRQMYGIVDR